MNFCLCTLAGTRACLTCPQYIEYFGQSVSGIPFQYPLKKTEVIEKFDENGKLIERITREV